MWTIFFEIKKNLKK